MQRLTLSIGAVSTTVSGGGGSGHVTMYVHECVVNGIGERDTREEERSWLCRQVSDTELRVSSMVEVGSGVTSDEYECSSSRHSLILLPAVRMCALKLGCCCQQRSIAELSC